ncbi:type II secretion system F family protein [Acidocella sp.]|uniref:type II secretion system F family protein n=1 Tax=Acidocella sp. TaxID=50710 RepID=UPI0026034C0E|nr:type II secretion system F family protein [Acidocella sp.]
MESEKLLIALALAVILLLLAAAVTVLLVREHDRELKLQARMGDIITPASRPSNAVEEAVSLVRNVSRMEQFRERAAALIGVDLQQAETYPIKWWLVPPLGVLLDMGLIFLLSHPLAGYPFLLFVTKTFGAVVFWYLITRFIFNMFTNRRNNKLIEQFPDALNTVVRCVRVGIPMGEALRTVSRDSMEPTKLEFTILADKVSIGVPLDVALRELALRVKLTEYQFFATALTLQARAGGGITQTLEGLSDVIRKRVGLKARGYALTAEARTSALVLSVLPFLAGGMIFMVQPPYIMTLFTTKGGESVITGAIVLLILGMGTIQFMISNVLK